MRPIKTPRLCLRLRRSSAAGDIFSYSPAALLGPSAGRTCQRSLEETRAIVRQGLEKTSPMHIPRGKCEGDPRSRRVIGKYGFQRAFPKSVVRELPDGKEAAEDVFCLTREVCLEQKKMAGNAGGGLSC